MSRVQESSGSAAPPSSATLMRHDPHLSQLLNKILFYFTMLAVLMAAIPFVFQWDAQPLESEEFITACILLPAFALAYVLNRRLYYRAAAWLAIIGLSVGTLYYATAAENNFTTGASYLLIPILLASILFGLRATLMLAIGQIVTLIALPTLVLRFNMRTILVDPISFIAIVSAILLMLAHERNKLERVRYETLRKSEQHYRAVFESPAIGVAVGTAEGLTDMNARFLEMLGYSREELLGKYGDFFTHPEDWAKETQYIAEMRAGNRSSYQTEKRYIRKDGSQFWVRATGAYLPPLADGTPPAGVMFAEDITERKQFEQALRESEERFFLLMDNIEAIFWITSSDLKQLNYISPGYDRIYGDSHRKIYEDITAWHQFIHPEDREKVKAELRIRAKGQTSDVGYRIIRPDGAVRYLYDRTFLIRDEHGAQRYIAGITVDVTESKQAELALEAAYEELEQRIEARTDELKQANLALKEQIQERELAQEELIRSQRRLQALFDNSLDAILMVAEDGSFVDINPAAPNVIGYSREELLGLRVWDVLPQTQPTKGEPPQVSWMRFLRDTPDKGQYVFADRAGEKREIEFRKTSDILPGLHLLMLRDITEQQRARQMEVQVEREKTQLFQRFIGNTSHDLRTPISVLNTSVYLLKRLTEQLIEHAEQTPQTPEEHEARRVQMQEIGEKIQERGVGLEHHLEHLQSLVESMHEMLRLDMDARFDFTRYNLNALVLEALNAYHANAEEKQLQLDFLPDEALPSIWVDSYEFNRVIHNLLQNAVRYTPSGGQIVVRTYQQAGEVVLEVKDNGIGIAKEDLPHIFERLYRADKARSLETGGFGLGLAIVKKIVEGHHGQVEVESTVGIGSVFRVRLPQR